MNLLLLKRPSDWIPITMSLAATAIVLAHVVMSGPAHEADEETAVHLWQLLIASQLPVVAFFAIKWIPRERRAATAILLLQAAGIVVALAPVYLLGL